MNIQSKGNNSVDWDEFNPRLYIREHYRKILPPDEEILLHLVNFYKSVHPRGLAIEVGCGPNLYPVFAILPYTDHIDLIDYSLQNVIYLKKQFIRFEKIWQQWVLFLRTIDPVIYNIDFQKQFQEKVSIYQSSIFDLPKNKYNSVSMHFVTESLTDDYKEFDKANKKFIETLKSGGTFTACFTENSQGYNSPGTAFPAVAITEKDIKKSLGSKAKDLQIKRIKTDQSMFTTIHTGILIASGSRKRLPFS